MNIYSVYVNPEQGNTSFISVKNGFSIAAMFFGVLWALYHKMWNIALPILAIHIFIMFQDDVVIHTLKPTINILSSLIFGIFATDMREYNLEKNGYQLKDIIYASSQEDSEAKFMKRSNLCD
jgi:hypothetical protein